ncbi:MAG TPA: tetratricopeptide repeat-containing glycosyltransferase family protein [Stellaceae bacterium]|nr:tetratricopeptide repeat-containing glycosyltransferase family protein [Stellaceae bacterium]
MGAGQGAQPPPQRHWTTVPQVLQRAEQLRQLGHLAQARDLCQQVVTAQPRQAEALHLLGIILHQAGDAAGAIEMLQRAVAVNPNVPLYFSNLGEILRLAGRFDEAVAAGERAVALHPGYAHGLNNLGIAYYDRREYERAADCYRRALARDPSFAEAHNNLGNAYRALHKLEDSIACFDRALRLRPTYTDAVANQASALHLIGRIDDAIAGYRKAIAMQPNHANAHSGVGLLYLMNGDFAEGWYEYEWRLRSTEATAPTLPGAVWGGESLQGRRILIYAEQGFGDALQFCRYLPLLRDRGAKVSLRVPAPVAPLVAESMPWLQISSDLKSGLSDYDCHCALLSLPHRMETRLETIPAAVPYLHAPQAALKRWAERIPTDPGELKVGIVWAGSKLHVNDLNRSIALSAWAPLLAVEGVRFFSLQVGADAPQVAQAPGREVTDLSSLLTDYAETAAAVEQLDLVIAVDTSVVHVAGALAKPTWVLLPWVPDWRWLRDREDSPWYPTMRLFRQPERFAWAPVIARAAEELAAARADRRRLTPSGGNNR